MEQKEDRHDFFGSKRWNRAPLGFRYGSTWRDLRSTHAWVPPGRRASQLVRSRYRAGEAPIRVNLSRTYHVLHDHLGGEVFIDGGGRHRRDKRGCVRQSAERSVETKSGQRVRREWGRQPPSSRKTREMEKSRAEDRACVQTTAIRTLCARARGVVRRDARRPRRRVVREKACKRRSSGATNPCLCL